jgi:poly(hydroxyalkanoate) depolymerase family esterase
MVKRTPISMWTTSYRRHVNTLARAMTGGGTPALLRAMQPALGTQRPPPGAGDWLAGVAIGAAGMRHYRLFRPPGVALGERLPMLVMLHGCGQDAKAFAASTRMNVIASRQRFFVLYPEQDRMANAQGCWNWFDTRSGRAHGEASLLMHALDQVCLLYPVDRQRVAVAGLSAGASMAALLAARDPDRFKAVAMHSGVPPGTAHSTVSAMHAMQGRRATAALPATAHALAAWPPLMVIHGGRDRVVSVHNGQAAVRVWADAMGASAGATRQVQRGRRYAMNVTEFKRGRSTVATLCEVDALGHAWSGGAAKKPYSDSHGPNASQMIWSFAARCFRAAA